MSEQRKKIGILDRVEKIGNALPHPATRDNRKIPVKSSVIHFFFLIAVPSPFSCSPVLYNLFPLSGGPAYFHGFPSGETVPCSFSQAVKKSFIEPLCVWCGYFSAVSSVYPSNKNAT